MHNNIAVGAGLISLDVLIWDGKLIPVGYYVGGTCGNVMMILAHMRGTGGTGTVLKTKLFGLKVRHFNNSCLLIAFTRSIQALFSL